MTKNYQRLLVEIDGEILFYQLLVAQELVLKHVKVLAHGEWQFVV
nr:role in expression of lactacin F, part of the laf operon [Lactobacillus sp.]